MRRYIYLITDLYVWHFPNTQTLTKTHLTSGDITQNSFAPICCQRLFRRRERGGTDQIKTFGARLPDPGYSRTHAASKLPGWEKPRAFICDVLVSEGVELVLFIKMVLFRLNRDERKSVKGLGRTESLNMAGRFFFLVKK